MFGQDPDLQVRRSELLELGLELCQGLRHHPPSSAWRITTMAAYAFSRMRFKGRVTMLKGILLIQVFPNLLALVAIYRH
ncbi:MAG: hypothetical protein M0C28_19785 [Candidatus Moduliflexus flocculans]|nr:hypothetical protein [Candidatus Moduliflexus flocculans]